MLYVLTAAEHKIEPCRPFRGVQDRGGGEEGFERNSEHEYFSF